MYAIKKTGTDLYFCGFCIEWHKMMFNKMTDGYICVFQTYIQAKEYMDFAIKYKWVNFSMEVDMV